MAVITGTNASDPELEGTPLADQIFGLGGNDILIGFDGDDVLEGGAGADELFGSLGFDVAASRDSSAGVRIFLDSFFTSGGDATGDHLYNIEGLIGSAHGDQFVGTDQRNIPRGEGGPDRISGGSDFIFDYIPFGPLP